MDSNRSTLHTLFMKYLAGECTPEEHQQVMEYFSRPEHERELRELIRKEFDKEIPVGKISHDTVNAVHDTLADILRKEQPLHQEINQQAPSQQAPRWIGWSRPAQAATWLLLILGLGALMYFQWARPAREGFSEIVTHLGERKKVELADGTVIWLNAASRLQYPSTFASDRRQVSLEGEAFFEVARDENRPFIIRSGELETTVLGTSFNIRAYQEEQTLAVSVLTGKVKVAVPEASAAASGTSASAELHLEPDQQVIFNKKERLLKKQLQVHAAGLAAWREGLFQFRNTTFSEVTAILQRSYNVQITYDPILENCPIIHADFDGKESVKTILKILLSSVNGTVQETGPGAYHLTSKVACKSSTTTP